MQCIYLVRLGLQRRRPAASEFPACIIIARDMGEQTADLHHQAAYLMVKVPLSVEASFVSGTIIVVIIKAVLAYIFLRILIIHDALGAFSRAAVRALAFVRMAAPLAELDSAVGARFLDGLNVRLGPVSR